MEEEAARLRSAQAESERLAQEMALRLQAMEAMVAQGQDGHSTAAQGIGTGPASWSQPPVQQNDTSVPSVDLDAEMRGPGGC